MVFHLVTCDVLSYLKDMGWNFLTPFLTYSRFSKKKVDRDGVTFWGGRKKNTSCHVPSERVRLKNCLSINKSPPPLQLGEQLVSLALITREWVAVEEARGLTVWQHLLRNLRGANRPHMLVEDFISQRKIVLLALLKFRKSWIYFTSKSILPQMVFLKYLSKK